MAGVFITALALWGGNMLRLQIIYLYWADGGINGQQEGLLFSRLALRLKARGTEMSRGFKINTVILKSTLCSTTSIYAICRSDPLGFRLSVVRGNDCC